MAPTHLHHYKPRSVNTGMAFTILFASIACFVILSCFVWGFVVPFLRKKYFPLKPSRTKYNYRSHHSGSSIPLIQTSSRNESRTSSFRSNPRHITMYNPRLQTPFPRMPSNPDSIVLPTFTPPRTVSPAANTSYSLFTPVRNVDQSNAQSAMVKSYTLPRVRSRERVKPNMMDKDFGDAREYILALPEPLHLKPQNDGGPLVGSNTMSQIPISSNSSMSADKHLHPRKLFDQLKGKDPRDSSCSSSSMKVQERNTDTAQDSTKKEKKDDTDLSSLPQYLPQGENNQQSGLAQGIANDMEPSPIVGESEPSAYNASVTAMHRLRTYRSLVGAPPPEPLSRAGTLTRPKTPVAKMRDIYDKTADDGKAASNTVSRNDTISTAFQTTTGSSDCQSAQSSASSAPRRESDVLTASTLSLIPTPLQIRHADRQHSTSTIERRNSRFTEELGEAEQCVSQPVRDTQGSPREAITGLNEKKAKPAATSGRPRPSPLKLNASARVPAHHSNPYNAKSPTTGRRLPHRRLVVGSTQASSVYSRDTSGLSLARTPVTPEFSGQTAYRPPFSPYLPSTIGAETDSDKCTETNLLQAKSSPSVSAAKQKVEDWEVDMGEMYFNTSPSPSLKRALSNLGPDCESTHEVSTVAEEDDRADPRHSIISTEMNPSEARLSSVVGAVRMSTCTEHAMSHNNNSYYRAAPGGADWL